MDAGTDVEGHNATFQWVGRAGAVLISGRSGQWPADGSAEAGCAACGCWKWCEREPANGKGLGRPGLDYTLESICVRQAAGLVVAELSRLTRSASDLGAII
jgi:hypothetical protein